MALVEIPLRNDLEAYFFDIDLSGKTYQFEFMYNSRADRWHMTLRDNEKSELITGIPVVISDNFLRRFSNPRLPPGRFVVLGLSEETPDPKRKNLGEDVFLLYDEV